MLQGTGISERSSHRNHHSGARCTSNVTKQREEYPCPHTVKSQPGTDAEKTKQPLDDGLQHYQLIIRGSI